MTCPFHLIHHFIQIMYRQNRQSKTHILETNNTSAELLVPFEEDYLIEIRTVSDGGDGSSSEEIRIPKMSSKLNHHRCCRFLNLDSCSMINSFMFLHLNLKKKKSKRKHTQLCVIGAEFIPLAQKSKFSSGYAQASGSRDRKYETHVLVLLFPCLWQASLINHDMHTELSHKSQILSIQCSKQVTPISQI